MKLYGLRYLKDESSYWDDYYAFSHDAKKLRGLVKGINRWNLGTSDVTNNKEEVCYTDKENYPQYSVVEVPFVV